MINVKKDFPVITNNLDSTFLDTSSGSLKPKCVISAITNYYENYGCNVDRNEYRISKDMTKIISNIRLVVKKFINAKEVREIIFTSGTTDSLNKAAFSFINVLKKGDEIIISKATHSSNVLPWKVICDLTGAVIKLIDLDSDQKITLEMIKKSISARTKIISIETISNVIGKINECEKIGDYINNKGIYYILDAAQSVAHIKTDVQKLKCHMLAFSGNKLLGPTGSGCLYINKDIHLIVDNQLKGGGTILNINKKMEIINKQYPNCFEPGTPNLAAIFGLGSAIEYILKIGFNEISIHEKELLNYTYQELNKIPQIEIYNKNADIGVISFNYKGIFCEDAGNALGKEGICIRIGDNCSKLLNIFNLENKFIRLSLYIYNDKSDIDKFIKALGKVESYLDEFF